MVRKHLIGKNKFEMYYEEILAGGRYFTVTNGIEMKDKTTAILYYAHDGQPIHHRQEIKFSNLTEFKEIVSRSFERKVPTSILNFLYKHEGKE